MQRSEKIDELVKALAMAQAGMTPIKPNSTNPHFKSDYADLSAYYKTTRPILVENQLMVVQTATGSGAEVGVETMLYHTPSGQWISDVVTVLVTDEGGRSKAQIAGSHITYLRRYGFAAITGAIASSDDDDGNAGLVRNMEPKPKWKPAIVQMVLEKTSVESEERAQRFLDSSGISPKATKNAFMAFCILYQSHLDEGHSEKESLEHAQQNWQDLAKQTADEKKQ